MPEPDPSVPLASGPAAVLLNPAAAMDRSLAARLDRLARRIPLSRHRVGGVAETEAQARRAAADGAAVIIAAGGDGTLHAAVNGVLAAGARTAPAVAVLPYGTGNDFARLIGLDPEGPAAGLDRPHVPSIIQRRPRRIKRNCRLRTAPSSRPPRISPRCQRRPTRC